MNRFFRLAALSSVVAAGALAGCAVQQPRTDSHSGTYRRSTTPAVLKTPRGDVRLMLMVGDDGSYPIDSVPGDHAGPYVVGLVDPRGFWYASRDGSSELPFTYELTEPGAWANLALTPDGRGLVLFTSGFSATRHGGGSGPVYVNVANARLPLAALSSLRSGDEVRLIVDADDAAPADEPAKAPAPAPANEWWRTPATGR